MHAAGAAPTVVVLGDAPFPTKDPRVVAAVAAKVHVPVLGDTREQIDVAVQVPGRVNDQEAAVAEEVEGGGKRIRQRLPGPMPCRRREASERVWRGWGVLRFRVASGPPRYSWELDHPRRRDLVSVEEFGRIQRAGASGKQVQCPRADGKSGAAKIRGCSDMVPVNVAFCLLSKGITRAEGTLGSFTLV